MELIVLSIKSLWRNPYRSGIVFTCVMLVAGSGMWATFITQGIRENIRFDMSTLDGPGVDILIVPQGSGYSKVGLDNVDLVELMSAVMAVQGIARASPQLRLLSEFDSQYCPGSDLHLVAYDPASDFNVVDALPEPEMKEIGLGEALIGNSISLPEGEHVINLAGFELVPLAQLSMTGSSLDQSILITFETAREIMLQTQDEQESIINTRNIPIILVKILPEYDSHQVTARILKEIRGITVIDRAESYRLGSTRLPDVLKRIPVILALLWILATIFIGMVFSIAVNDRRREIGILRSLGFTHVLIHWILMIEGLFLVGGGGLAGVVLGILLKMIFGSEIIRVIDLPLAPVSTLALFEGVMGSLVLTIISVLPGVILPVWMINRKEPALILRG